MHPRNKMRLLAGLTIDHALERKQVTEARTVPMSRAELKPKNEKNLRAEIANVKKAIGHLKNAVKALESVPATSFNGDVPYFIHQIEQLISSDSGESGMESYLSVIQQQFDSKFSDVSESLVTETHFKKGDIVKDSSGKEWKVLGWTGKGDNEVYQLQCPATGKKTEKPVSALNENVTFSRYEQEEQSNEKSSKPGYDTSAVFDEGDKVLYDNGIWIVHLADAKANLVGIVPASMANASKEEKDRAMQQVKCDKLRKPSEEECEVMAGPDGVLGTADDIRMESTNVTDYNPPSQGGTRKELLRKYAQTKDPAVAELARKAGATQNELKAALKESTYNYTPSNAVSYQDDDTNPVNVVAQDSKSWANSLNPEYVKNEYTSQLDQRGDQSMDDYVNKVKVPTKVKTALKDAIAEFEKEAEKQGKGHTGTETKQLYQDTAAAFQQILDLLNNGNIIDIKKAQHLATTLMGPMLHKIPDVVWDFLSNGGQKRSLKDYMFKVKGK